ncbi:endonuclease/exonuclease/phosphatase family protein [Yoonia sp. F2084L]|uniref:endonuclease/exonuclease/phosphatase family protein n=1 Tax=Yoonia sp. F2084L TaxID=2926419 RepID=UPI001FF35B62|nr:endonuclease/exonuclease/phosphatase family protein [Yoonia sp. F2084L]MCK0097305.1 endonuclease/exonuclease/phosphatase family protein [Yoonia sp. F2084L]
MSDLMITGVIDGDLSGGLPKAIQLTAISDIADLSVYGVGSANNGNGGGVVEFTFPAIPLPAGTTIYIASETDSFTAFFGFPPDFTGGVANINGDDAIELFENDIVVDVFGDVNTDGSGEVWEYMDGWASRPVDGGPNPIFDPAAWTFSGPNALDDVTDNASAPSPFPTPGVVPPEATVAINEYRISSPSPDDDTSNFVELFTDPGASLAGKTLLVISGEFAPGTIDFAIDLSGAVADEGGFVLIGNDQNPNLGVGDVGVAGLDFFGSPQSFLIVDGFTGAAGDDLDVDDDGVFDAPPWDAVLDSVSAVDGDPNPDVNYSDTIVPADGNFPAAGAARDVDGTGDFVPLPFGDQAGDTPGSTNDPDIPAPRLTIMEIQGAGHVSGLISDNPLDPSTGQGSAPVITGGIVTAVDSNGFYMQDPDGDGDIATSDAIFVFTGSVPGVAIGDAVDVSGTVSEFYPGGQGSGNLSTTQIGGNPEITVLSSGNALPASVILGADGRPLPSENIEDDNFTSFDPTTDGIDFWESLEGMLVTAPQPVAVSGTSGFGELFVVVDGGEGATGLSDRGTLNISPDDFNPEKVQIDWDFGLDAIDVNTGAVLDDVTGVVSYDFGNFQINPTEQIVVVEPSLLEPESTSLAGSENQLTIASYNVLNLDPIVEDQALTNNGEARNVDDDVGDGRFDTIANQIVNNLGSPDIIGLQEIQDSTGGETGDGVVSAALTFETLIDAIDMADDGIMNDSSGYAYIDNTFITDLASGGQPGGNIRTGFLYKEDRVSLVEGSVQTIGSQDPGGAFEGARLPLVATFAFNGEEVTVVNNHFSSKGGSAPILGVEQDFADRQEDVDVNGSLDERQAQSEAVAAFVADELAADPQANVVVVGDFNEFEFVSPVTGLEDAGLTNLTNTLPEDERYTFNFQGNSQALDHILVSDGLAADAQFDIVHVNSEFADADDRGSDHDPLLALLTIGDVAPDTVDVAVAFDSRGLFGTKATESIDGVAVDTDKLSLFKNAVSFRDVDVRLIAEAPGREKLTFIDGEVGVWSRGDSFFRGEIGLVNDDEALSFKLQDGDFGDATEAFFDFGDLRGNGDVEVLFLNDGMMIGSQVVDASAGAITAGQDGAAFDAVQIRAVGDTAFSLDGFGFERLVEDAFVFA